MIRCNFINIWNLKDFTYWLGKKNLVISISKLMKPSVNKWRISRIGDACVYKAALWAHLLFRSHMNRRFGEFWQDHQKKTIANHLAIADLNIRSSLKISHHRKSNNATLLLNQYQFTSIQLISDLQNMNSFLQLW